MTYTTFYNLTLHILLNLSPTNLPLIHSTSIIWSLAITCLLHPIILTSLHFFFYSVYYLLMNESVYVSAVRGGIFALFIYVY